MDERALITSLSSEVALETLNDIRSGTILSIIDAYDRRVPRAVFLDIVTHSLPLYDWIGSLEMVNRIAALYTRQKVSEPALAEAAAEFSNRADSARRHLLGRMKAVVACAPSDATLH